MRQMMPRCQAQASERWWVVVVMVMRIMRMSLPAPPSTDAKKLAAFGLGPWAASSCL